MGISDRRASILARRIPIDQIEQGRAYVIHARNGGVGIATRERHHHEAELGYVLHREKFGNHFLFTEYDWEEGPDAKDGLKGSGTAIPVLLIDEVPPADRADWLDWLAVQEKKFRPIRDAMWAVMLDKREFDADSWKSLLEGNG